jgi:hypothetical protein
MSTLMCVATSIEHNDHGYFHADYQPGATANAHG